MPERTCPMCDGRKTLSRCPRCGHQDGFLGFDVAGADGGNRFCTQCHHEDEMEDGAVCPRCAGEGVVYRESHHA